MQAQHSADYTPTALEREYQELQLANAIELIELESRMTELIEFRTDINTLIALMPGEMLLRVSLATTNLRLDMLAAYTNHMLTTEAEMLALLDMEFHEMSEDYS